LKQSHEQKFIITNESELKAQVIGFTNQGLWNYSRNSRSVLVWKPT